MAKFKEFSGKASRLLKSNRFEAVCIGFVLLIVVLVAATGVIIKQRNVLAASVEQKAVVSVPAVAPSSPNVEVKEAKVQLQPIVATSPEQKPKVAEVVTTIRQVGGGEEVIKDWHNKAVSTVKLPVVKDIGWGDILKKDGKPLYLVAISSDKGSVMFQGANYVFDKGYTAVFITAEPESIALTTTWNDSDEKESDRHFNIWSEVFVINSTMDPDLTAKRLLAEWTTEQGKPSGFYVKMDGTVEIMKRADAVAFYESNPPLFPSQLPELPAGVKSIVMTVTQVGSDSLVISELNNPDATSVSMPKEDSTVWEGIQTKDGKPLYIVLVSSDPGTVTFNGKTKEIKTGYVAAFITTEPGSIVLTTGWNEDNLRFNVSAQKFVISQSENVDDVIKDLLKALKKKDGKPLGFAILSDGEEFEIK